MISANTTPTISFTLVLDLTSALICLLRKATEKHLKYERGGGGGEKGKNENLPRKPDDEDKIKYTRPQWTILTAADHHSPCLEL